MLCLSQERLYFNFSQIIGFNENIFWIKALKLFGPWCSTVQTLKNERKPSFAIKCSWLCNKKLHSQELTNSKTVFKLFVSKLEKI